MRGKWTPSDVRPRAPRVTHLMRDGDVVGGVPRRRAAIFRARNAVGERKGARFRDGGSIREKHYTKRARRKSSEIAHRPGAISTFRPLPNRSPTLLPRSPRRRSHTSGRQPTFPTSPERGHYGVTRRNTFPALSVHVPVCARTERRVTQATRWEEIPAIRSDGYANVIHTASQLLQSER